MRKRQEYIKVSKCTCGRQPELLGDSLLQWHVYCDKCHKETIALAPKQAIKQWNDLIERKNDKH